jgi:hypothetical protein
MSEKEYLLVRRLSRKNVVEVEICSHSIVDV